MQRPPHIITVFLAQIIRHSIQILVLDETNYYSFLVFLSHALFLLFLFWVISLSSLQDIDERTLYDLDNGFIDLKSFLEFDLNRFVVVPIDKLVEGFQLLRVPMPQPLPYLGELSADRPLLISI